jgi:hypothetical protein
MEVAQVKAPYLHAASALLLALSLSSGAQAKKVDASAATIAARSKIFGAANVDQRTGEVNKDRVILSWITNASFAAAAGGRVMLLDTFVTRLEVIAGRTPLVIQDLVDLHPDAIFLGHGHGDHADNAAFLSQQTGAPIFASPETCDVMQRDAQRNFSKGFTTTSSVTCNGVTTRGSIPGSEVVRISVLEPDVSVVGFKHLHSTNTAPQDTTFPPVIINSPVKGVCATPCNLQDPRDPALFPAGVPLQRVMDIRTLGGGAGGPIEMGYAFTVKGENNFRFLWHNSSGALREGCALPNNDAAGNPFEPGQAANGCFGPAVGAQVSKVLESFRPVDVQLGSVVSLGFGINGERDIVDYITHVAPKVFLPIHTTAVAVEGSSLEWRDGFFKQLDAMSIPDEARPEVDWLVDPTDYLRPRVFDTKDARFKK